MLCLIDIRRDDDPSWQRLLRAVEDAHTLTELLLADGPWPVLWRFTSSKLSWPSAPADRLPGRAARHVEPCS